MPQSTITSFLQGTTANPTASTVFQLADVLDCDPRDLMIQEENE